MTLVALLALESILEAYSEEEACIRTALDEKGGGVESLEFTVEGKAAASGSSGSLTLVSEVRDMVEAAIGAQSVDAMRERDRVQSEEEKPSR